MLKLLLCMLLFTSCSYYTSDPTRPDIAKKAKQIRNTHTERFSGE